MATNKRPSRKKVASKTTTLRPFKIKDGDYFSAKYKDPYSKSRKPPVKIMGVVQINEAPVEEIYLNNSTIGTDNMCCGSDFEYFLTVSLRAGLSILDAIAKEGLSNFTILTDARQKAVVEAQKFLEVHGYRAKMDGDSVIFGCGDVQLSKHEVKVFHKVLNKLTPVEIQALETVLESLNSEGINVSEIDFEEVDALVAKF